MMQAPVNTPELFYSTKSFAIGAHIECVSSCV